MHALCALEFLFFILFFCFLKYLSNVSQSKENSTRQIDDGSLPITQLRCQRGMPYPIVTTECPTQ